MTAEPDHRCLFDIASEQHGYFTAAQARSCGVKWDRLTDATQRGRYIRIRRGLYRLRDYPTFPREEVTAAWLAIGKDIAVVSHDSALELHDLSDVIPEAVHLTVPRSKRYVPSLPGVVVHTTTKSLRPLDITVQDGIKLTSPSRTILDAAEAGTAPNQIETAIQQAMRRGLITRTEITRDASNRSRRIARLVETALQGLPA
ncbi:MAG: type IV toxin-antitoxin system AbiEi family antitoxin domain-containing protein [Thermomicrobiales bacterium]